MREGRPALLVVTPSLVGGSWLVVSELTQKLGDRYDVVVAGVGPPPAGGAGLRVFRLPWLDYEEYGPRIVNNLLGILWFEIPLAILSLYLWIRLRPRVWLGNGLLSAALGIVPQKISGGHIVVSYNSYMGGARPHLLTLAGEAARHSSVILANSEASRQDVARLVDPAKVKILPLTAEDLFFADGAADALRSRLGLKNDFVVLFVGRLDREKHCDFLLKVAKVSDTSRVFFVLVGHGELIEDVKALSASTRNVIYAGRILSREELRDYYQMADVVWSYADETYLAKPAVEALASGTPIIVPDAPALLMKAHGWRPVDPGLVPSTIGWLVQLDSPQTVAKMIEGIANQRGRLADMRADCRAFARIRYSSQVLRGAVEDIAALLEGPRGEPLRHAGGR